MIIDLQRRLAEIGRIRIGQQVPVGSSGKSRPAKLDTFRLTSPDGHRIGQVAALYGGTPEPWETQSGAQWEVITSTDKLPVIVPPGDIGLTQWYELWSGGGCQRRCDGHHTTFNDPEGMQEGECLCDPDNRECKRHTRLSVMLRDLPGIGLWRLDTQGFYASEELAGAINLIQMVADHGHMVPAQLRLEQRMVKRPGQQTRRFAVPVLDVEITPQQLLNGVSSTTIAAQPNHEVEATASLTPVPETVHERPTRPIADQIAPPAKKPRRKNSAQPIPATGVPPRTAGQAAEQAALDVIAEAGLTSEPPPETESSTDEPITPQQLKLVLIAFRKRGFGDDKRPERLAFCEQIIKRSITSSMDLTKDEASRILDELTS